jgi:hypothetical protein
MVYRADLSLIHGCNSLSTNQRTLTGPISIQSGVRQGCPLSMILYACLQPFLHSMTDILPPLRIGQCMRYFPVLTYADDVTVFVTQPAAFTDIQQAIQRYERASGALLNPRKSKALAIGNWAVPATALRTDFQDHINILGVTFRPTITQSIKDSWSGVICSVRAEAKTAYGRNLSLAQRLQYLQLCLLA